MTGNISPAHEAVSGVNYLGQRVASRRLVTCLPQLECYRRILRSCRLNDRQSRRAGCRRRRQRLGEPEAGNAIASPSAPSLGRHECANCGVLPDQRVRKCCEACRRGGIVNAEDKLSCSLHPPLAHAPLEGA